ncbi:hypothetical protein F0562_030939 [Nyssa sinensis]|uniref:Protein kinase domain-containing protein n=1 Tax=Nyssa sinensis TaxID=561372 RepID=A0A5J5AVY0_9ASTE|nr:hypothetical protein F0562_030939 [Nyssa sinensis]
MMPLTRKTSAASAWLVALVHALCLTGCIAKKNNQRCSSSCGDIQNIEYPFRLKGDPSSCGDTHYELYCENNRTIVQLDQRKYYVREIRSNNKTILIVDPLVKKGNCFSSPLYSLTLENMTNLYYPVYLYYDVIVFMNCKEPISRHNYVPIIPCHMNGSSPASSSSSSSSLETNAYAFVGQYATLSDIPPSCTIGVTVPAPNLAEWDFSNASASDLQDALLMGFELSFDHGSSWDLWYYFMHFLSLILYSFVYTLRGVIFGRGLPAGQAEQGFRIFVYCTRTIEMFMAGRIVVAISCLVAAIIYKFRRRHLSMDDNIEEFLQRQNNLMPIRYSYSQIKQMSKNFKEKLGQGGYGSVFKGKLRSGLPVAIKVLVGYIAPEVFYNNFGKVSYKADVYSFGMLLMEMVGVKDMKDSSETSSKYFPSWIYEQFHKGEDIEMGDATEDEKKIAKKMTIVALWCILMNPVDRPSMIKVLEMLEGDVELLQLPSETNQLPQHTSLGEKTCNESSTESSYLFDSTDSVTLDVIAD